MQPKGIQIALKILGHVAVIFALYLVFSFSLFLGLQVRPMFGNIGILVTALLVCAYVYFGFVRKRGPEKTVSNQSE